VVRIGVAGDGRWGAKYQEQKQSLLTMEFKRFLNVMMRLPCQVLRTGRRIVYRLLSWNPWMEVLLRAVETLRPVRVVPYAARC